MCESLKCSVLFPINHQRQKKKKVTRKCEKCTHLGLKSWLLVLILLLTLYISL